MIFLWKKEMRIITESLEEEKKRSIFYGFQNWIHSRVDNRNESKI